MRFHDLRHTFASLLLQQGESSVYVKDQMGHSSIQVTVDLYGHLIPGGNRQAVDQLDSLLEVSAQGGKPHLRRTLLMSVKQKKRRKLLKPRRNREEGMG